MLPSELGEQCCDFPFEIRQITVNSVPHNLGVYCKVIVNENVTHAYNLPPRHIGREYLDFLRQGAGCLTDNLKVAYKPVLNQLAGFKRLSALRGVSLDMTYRLQNIP